MLEKFRYRRVTAALADVCGPDGGDAVFVGCSPLARLVAAHKVAGLTVRGAVAVTDVGEDGYRACAANVVVAWGEVGAITAIAAPLVVGGQLLWFSTLPPEVAAGRALCGGLTEIKQRHAGRYLLTVAARSVPS